MKFSKKKNLLVIGRTGLKNKNSSKSGDFLLVVHEKKEKKEEKDFTGLAAAFQEKYEFCARKVSVLRSGGLSCSVVFDST